MSLLEDLRSCDEHGRSRYTMSHADVLAAAEDVELIGDDTLVVAMRRDRSRAGRVWRTYSVLVAASSTRVFDGGHSMAMRSWTRRLLPENDTGMPFTGGSWGSGVAPDSWSRQHRVARWVLERQSGRGDGEYSFAGFTRLPGVEAGGPALHLEGQLLAAIRAAYAEDITSLNGASHTFESTDTTAEVHAADVWAAPPRLRGVLWLVGLGVASLDPVAGVVAATVPDTMASWLVDRSDRLTIVSDR